VETAKQWNNIRARYGLPHLEVVGQDGKAIPVSGASAPVSSGELTVGDEQDDFI